MHQTQDRHLGYYSPHAHVEQRMGSMAMNPQMMQMRMQQMMKMEQHLEKIESLLAQLLEVQQPR